MGQNIDDKDLIKETYAASLQPERLEAFEGFWEAYIDQRLEGDNPRPIEDQFLQSHFSMALGIVERIRHEREEEDYFHRLIMSHPGLAFIMDQEGHIIAGNPPANIMLEDIHNLRSLPIDETDYQELVSWMQNQHKRERAGRSPYAFKDVSWGNGQTTTLMLAPVYPAGLTPSIDRNTDIYFLVSRIDLNITEAALPTIQERYRLTFAEATVAMHLANGASVKDIALKRDTSEQTVRTQVKQILSKTNTRDIAKLVHLILSLGGKFNSVTQQTARFETAEKNQNLIRIYNLILPDGRFLEYMEQGHPKGMPVLQMHSSTNGVRLTDSAAKKAVLAGWRFITPSRPGYGNSDPNPTKNAEDNVNAAVRDFRDLLDHLKIDKVHILSGWAGCFSQRFTLQNPDRVIGIVQTGSVPIWHLGHLNYMKRRHRIILKTSLFAPAAAPYMMRVAKALIDSGKTQFFVEGVEKGTEVDYNVLRNNTHLFDIIAEGHEHNLKQGVQAMVNDLKTIHTNWIEDSRQLRVPVTVLRGSENSDQPESAFTKYKAAVPHANIKMVEGAGAYLYLTHIDRVLEELGLLNQ